MVAARTGVRIAMSIFVAVLVWLSVMGWRWVGTHLSPTQALAGRVVLAAGAAAAIGALGVLWRHRPADEH